MTEVHRDEAGTIYLRAYEDPYKYSMKLTPSDQAGLARASWRTTSAQA